MMPAVSIVRQLGQNKYLKRFCFWKCEAAGRAVHLQYKLSQTAGMQKYQRSLWTNSRAGLHMLDV